MCPTEKFKYDALGHKTEITDRAGFTTRIRNNVKGKPLSIVYPDGISEKFEYNPDGTLLKAISKQGSYTLFTRDCFGRVTKEETHSEDGDLYSIQKYLHGAFGILSEEDAEGLQTNYTYDTAGRLICKTIGDHKTTYEYDTIGHLSKEIFWISDNEAKVKTLKYDLLDRIIEEKLISLEGKIYNEIQYTYDIFGQKTEVRIGHTLSRTVFNTQQMPIEIIDGEDHTTYIAYDYFFVNSLGQRVLRTTLTDPMGNRTIEEKDVAGNVFLLNVHNSVGLLLKQSRCYYSPSGDLTLTQNDRIVKGTIQTSIQHKWTYNSSRQVLCLIEALGSPEQRTRSYRYNSKGQKSHLCKPDGSYINYNYDGKGRLSTLSSSDQTLNYEYIYNRVDALVEVYDNVHQTKTIRKYNSQHQLQSELLANGLEIAYEYDRLGRTTKIQLPDQSCIDYHYDPATLREIQRGSYSHAYSDIDQNGNLLESRLPYQAGIVRYTYDKLNRVKTLHHPQRFQEIPVDGFDKAGNLLKFHLTESNTTETHTFSYDDLYQLIQENGHEDHNYAYDSMNNRILKDGQNCAINDLNQLLNQEDCEFKYDLNGNLLEKKDKNGTNNYIYDALNRLITIQTPEKSLYYTYDSFDRRLTKNDEKYLYDGQNHIATYKNTSQVALRILGTTREAEIGGAISLEFGDQVYIPLHDHNGNLVKLLNRDGSEYKTYQYTAFGLELNVNPGDINPWRFASKYYDAETGLIYFGRRFYDPSIGRWISPDPSEYDDGPNLYGYLHNNPLTHYDAYGLSDEDGFFTSAGNRALGYLDVGCDIACGLNDARKFGWRYTNAQCQGILRNDWSEMRSIGQDAFNIYTNLSEGCSNNFWGTSAQIVAPNNYNLCSLPSNAPQSVRDRAEGRAQAECMFLGLAVFEGTSLIRNLSKFRNISTLENISNISNISKSGSEIGTISTQLNHTREISSYSSVSGFKLRNQLTAQEIAGGHAFEKHVILKKEFTGFIQSQKQFADHIEGIINNPSHFKNVSNNRVAFWDSTSETLVVKNPKACDGGTAFRPDTGIDYYHNKVR